MTSTHDVWERHIVASVRRSPNVVPSPVRVRMVHLNENGELDSIVTAGGYRIPADLLAIDQSPELTEFLTRRPPS